MASRSTQPSAGLLRRIVRALSLHRTLYTEVLREPAATRQAAIVVVLVAVAHALGATVRAYAGRESVAAAWSFGAAGELAFWVAAAAGSSIVARVTVATPPTFGAVLRGVGFACAPGLLILVASLASLAPVGAKWIILPVLVAWRLAALFVAARATVRTTLQAVLSLVVAVIAGLSTVAAVTATLHRFVPS